MIKYGLLYDWYVKLRFITCKEETITPSVHYTVHAKQITDCVPELYALFYRMPFLVLDDTHNSCCVPLIPLGKILFQRASTYV